MNFGMEVFNSIAQAAAIAYIREQFQAAETEETA